jgi:CheY-like chemotaxis protein
VEAVNLNELVDETMLMFKTVISENVQLTIELGEGAGSVRADRAQLKQVLINLVVNARDAMPGGGALLIQTGGASGEPGSPPGGPFALLTVRDTGQGMTPDTVSRIFEPFFTTKQTGLGTGLGLATVQRIVNQVGGTVTVDSELGTGTTFRVYLPLSDLAVRSVDRAESLVSSPPGSETVLVVEDREAMRQVVVEMLKGLGYQVLQAAGPREALELTRSTGQAEIQLLLTDVVMPEMSGPELARELTQICPALRVLYMTGYAEDEMLHYGTTTGRVELIAKPFTVQELAQRLRQILD